MDQRLNNFVKPQMYVNQLMAVLWKTPVVSRLQPSYRHFLFVYVKVSPTDIKLKPIEFEKKSLVTFTRI